MVTNRFLQRCLLFFIIVTLAFRSYGQTTFFTHDPEYTIISGSSGIYAENNSFSPEKLFPKNTWFGDWIWLNQSTFKDFQNTHTEWIRKFSNKKQFRALFRKTFEMDKIPDEAIISISADVSYRLFVNGIFVCQGPPNIGSDYFDSAVPQHWFYTCHNIKKLLLNGKNTIAVEVYNHSNEISETTTGEGKLICDLETGAQKPILASDATWKCNVDTSFKSFGNKYFMDANLEPINWTSPDFDDSKWEKASVKVLPKDDFLRCSQIPVTFRHPVKPEKILITRNDSTMVVNPSAVFTTKTTQTAFTLDFGKNITAWYSIKVDAHKGDTIKIFPFEKRKTSINRSLTFICKEGRNSFAAPYLSVFRYLKVEANSIQGMVIENIDVEFSTYPVNHTGEFVCSDTTLTMLWNITRHTAQLCMNDMFYDSPMHQEPNACTGDYFIESLISFYAFGDPWLCRQTLVKTALMLEKNNNDMFHTSYSLLWVQMLHEYFLFTGDTALISELLPHVNRLNELFETYLDEDFLVSNAPDYMFMDWIKIDKFNAHHPPAVIGMGYMTAFYYKSLKDAAYLNALLNNKTKSDKNLDLAQKIKAAMNYWLWDQEKKLYKDGIAFRSKASNHWFFPPDEDIVTYSPHVNTLAVLYDIAPEDQQATIMKYVLRQNEIDLQPYFTFFVLSAISHINTFNTDGLEVLKKWKKGIDTETFTLKENWQDVTETGYKGDYSHAWGGSPLYFLSREILGVRPGKPGYKVIEITPFVSDQINWARGKVPVNNNDAVEISWENHKNDYFLSITIPSGYCGFLRPCDELLTKQVVLNGKPLGIVIKNLELSEGNNVVGYKNH
jgi:hypothetical protein